ncbi:hypothetical protein [Atopomonas sediminilitoris]|uniref:hypothetical protein n=1 Tax=Atopomonas sediminilitoris TaxID=2919919 RepID=UPI001F4EB2D5|nr:hypothetical protein [Atopomonas sediminilitoris]MCJ8169378.1 hypothetical protein [Atopomonas sediminilitoris]
MPALINTSRLVTVSAVLGLSAAVWWWWPSTSASQTNPKPATASAGPSAAPIAAHEATAASLNAEQQALLQAPQTQAYQDKLAFESTLRDFFSQASALPEASRDAQAEAFAQAIEEREASGALAMNEALLLHIALIQAQGADEASQKAAADQLLARYQARSAARAQQGLKDAVEAQAFQQYKSEEARIVSEVMASSDSALPLGVTRDEYLRQRLQAAREAALANASGAARDPDQSN